jgi:hypothetical protein
MALELSTQVPNGATEEAVGAHRFSVVSQIADPVETVPTPSESR